MKTSLLNRIPGVSRLFGLNTAKRVNPFTNGPSLKSDTFESSQLRAPQISYSAEDLKSGSLRCPTAALYSPSSATAGDVLGRNIGAPLYDNICDAVKRLKQRLGFAPKTASASAAAFIDTAPTVGNTGWTTKSAITAAAVASAGIMACGANGDLSDVLTKAIFFNLIGGLGLFLFGMKIMDEGLKTASGDTMKKVISKLTGNRFLGLGVGAGITGLIQSSSITTVITLGLVDAGLMNLTQALGVVAGANIGTTITGWLFSINVVKYGLPMLGASTFINLISKNERVKNFSQGVLGLGMVFLGLTTMSAGFKDPVIKQHLTELFSHLDGTSVWDIGACILLSTGITAGIQSSSATLGITIALAKTGIIPYETAVGLVLGSNIGTTITAWLAALRSGTSTEAKRVAIAHSLFNIIGVMAIWPWSPAFAEYTKKLAMQMGIDDPGIQVAYVHTLFNVAASAAFLATLNPFERLVVKLAPDKTMEAKEKTGYGHRRLSNALLKADAPDFALDASQAVISDEMNRRVDTMFENLLSIMTDRKTVDDIEPTVRLNEEELDQLQENLYHYFNHLERGHLDKKCSTRLDIQRHITSNLESIGDGLLKLLLIRKKNMPEDLSEKARECLRFVHQNAMDHFILVSEAVIKNDLKGWSEVKSENDRIKAFIEQHERNVVQGSAFAQIFFSDALGLYRELLGNIKNIAEALAGKK